MSGVDINAAYWEEYKRAIEINTRAQLGAVMAQERATDKSR